MQSDEALSLAFKHISRSQNYKFMRLCTSLEEEKEEEEEEEEEDLLSTVQARWVYNLYKLALIFERVPRSQ